MTYDEIVAAIKINPSPAQDMACRFLEGHGLRFCVDFGVLNAEQRMADICQDRFTEYDYRLSREMGIAL